MGYREHPPTVFLHTACCKRFHFETSLTRLNRAISFGARISLLSIPGPSR
ncbi:hypothetical protein EAH_00066800, partial [Eimeria acervulina]